MGEIFSPCLVNIFLHDSYQNSPNTSGHVIPREGDGVIRSKGQTSN